MIAQAHFTIADLSDATAEVIVGTQAAATNAWTGNATFCTGCRLREHHRPPLWTLRCQTERLPALYLCISTAQPAAPRMWQ